MDNPARNLLKRLYMVTKDAEFLEKWAELDVDNFRQSQMADYIKLLYKKAKKKELKKRSTCACICTEKILF